MTHDLKPCKCGGLAHLHITSRGKYWYECGSCWHSSRQFWFMEEAAEDWNTRMSRPDTNCDEEKEESTIAE